MNEKTIIVKYVKCCDVEVVCSFYGRTTYRNKESVKEEDEIVAAFEVNKMVGVYRVCNENGVYVLRGFNVLADYQGKGIGQLMLKKFENEIKDRACFLICKKGLNHFYGKAGFAVCKENAPEFLMKRKESYKNDELNILVRNKN